VAVILVLELTVNEAVVLPSLTEVVPLKLLPLIVTTVTGKPRLGVKLLIVGFGAVVVTVKLLVLVPVPFPVVTAIGPVVAPEGTVAVIFTDELTVYEVAVVPLNLTAVTPVKFVPLIVTPVPTGPLVGENEVTVGGLPPPPVTVKLLVLVPVPFPVVTAIGPVDAPDGT